MSGMNIGVTLFLNYSLLHKPEILLNAEGWILEWHYFSSLLCYTNLKFKYMPKWGPSEIHIQDLLLTRQAFQPAKPRYQSYPKRRNIGDGIVHENCSQELFTSRTYGSCARIRLFEEYRPFDYLFVWCNCLISEFYFFFSARIPTAVAFTNSGYIDPNGIR